MSRRALPPDRVPHERRVLFEGLGISVVDFHCRAGVEPAGPEEPNPTHSIVHVRKGTFERTRERETVLADANSVLFFNAAQPYRYSHPLPGGDHCTILTVETERALELVAHHAPGDAERSEAPFRLGHGLSSPGLARLHYEFLALVGSSGSSWAIEDALSELADESVRAAYQASSAEVDARATGAISKAREWALVEATKLLINERITSPPSLAELGRSFGCSPFHISRVFRRTAGVSLRSYIKRLRARLAADRLAVGERDLTNLALDLGYADHSHFTNAFRRELGVPPSRFRARAGCNRPR